LCHPRVDTDARHIFEQKITTYEAQGRVIVYIDESGFAHDMPRTHGYSLEGQRVFGTHNWQARGRTNAIGALIGKLLLTIGLFEVNINADIFQSWVINDLLPKLPPHSVIVMDNATFHKRQDTQNAIADAGHTLLYSLSYME
jgi:DDE superfamily endonuclease